MRINVYRVMKVVYHVLDPSNEPSSTIDEVKHIATLEYAVSQEKEGPPEISSLIIHLRLSAQTDTRFDVVLHDMQIEDKVENTCISLPGELASTLMDISRFVREFVIRRSAIKWKPASDCSFGRRIWDQMQEEVGVALYSSTIMMQIKHSRNTISVFHSRRLLAAQTPVESDALHAPSVPAKAVRLYRAGRPIAVHLANLQSYGALSIKTTYYAFRASKSKGLREN